MLTRRKKRVIKPKVQELKQQVREAKLVLEAYNIDYFELIIRHLPHLNIIKAYPFVQNVWHCNSTDEQITLVLVKAAEELKKEALVTA